MKSFVGFALAIANAAIVIAEVAPVGEPFQFQIAPNGPCINAPSNRDGEVVFIEECTTLPQSRSWVSSVGGVATGKGPAGTIRIYGDKCLDVKDGADKSGTKLQIWTCGTNNPNQMWQINGDKTIEWAGKGKCVDLTNGNTANGNQLQVWTCDSKNNNQRWAAKKINNVPEPGVPAGQPVLLHINSDHYKNGPCLTAASNSSGAQVILQSCGKASPANSWTVEKGGASYGSGLPGTIRIFGNKCLDVTGGTDVSGTKLQIWTCTAGNKNQQWNVNGDFTIGWAGHNKCVDLTGGTQVNGNRIQLWSCGFTTPNPNQQWRWTGTS